MPLTIGNIEFYMGPQQTGGPDDLLTAIIDFIDGAKKKLYIAVQELDELAIAEAVIRARQRKVVVKLVLEGDYLTVSRAVKHPFTPGGTNEHNRMLHDAVLRAKIDVHSDFNPKIFHQKFMVRDGSSVLTGSTNFTTTGVTKNLNHIVIIHDRKIANIYQKEFKEIQQGHFGKLNEGHDESPREVIVSDIPVKVLFAPDHSPEMEIMKQMTKGQDRIDFAVFTFSQSSGIDDTMLKCIQAGMTVRGALDGQQANQKWAATRILKNATADLSIVSKSKTVGKLHHKLMVIDDRVVILGSFNYTGPANRLNDENIVVFGDLDTGQSATAVKKQKKFAAYARKEIERIIAAHGKDA